MRAAFFSMVNMIELKDGEVLEELFADKKIIQNASLYRFTSDSILLSRFARAKVNDVVADFCSGCGIVGLHFLCLNPHISSVTLFEMQPALSDMARRTIEFNGFSKAKAVCSRIQDIGREYNDAFSLIVCNPPYERGGPDNISYEKAVCRKEITINLKEILSAAYRKLKYGGRLAIINRADRLAEMFYTMKNCGLEPKKMQFVCGREGGTPYLVMAEAVKGGRPGTLILPPAINSPDGNKSSATE